MRKGNYVAADDTSGLDLFDETASAVAGFPQALRGYDRGAVDAYVAEVEAELSSAKAQLRQQRRQLAQASSRVGNTDYSNLGAHARSLLGAAEAQAEELISSAGHRARHIMAQAQAEAEKTAITAQLSLDAARAASTEDLNAVRRRLSEQTALELSAARDEGDALLEFSRRRAAELVAEAMAKADLLAREADLAAVARRVAAEREATEHQLSVVTEREAALADVKAAHVATAAELEHLVAQAQLRMAEHAARLEADSLTWEQRREAARAEAAEIVASARTEAAGILQEADDRAKAQRAAMLLGTEQQKAGLDAEIALLIGRRKAIVAQLGELSALAGSSAADYGDGVSP
ncbi:MAG: DivIVA domain-containing protein [Propionicimonas sp.]